MPTDVLLRHFEQCWIASRCDRNTDLASPFGRNSVAYQSVNTTDGNELAVKLKVLDKAVVPFVLPIWGVSKRGRLTPVGSGVLLTVDSRFFVVTAGHVYDQSKYSFLATWGPPDEPLLELHGVWNTTTPSWPRRDRDRFDLAILHLEVEVVRALMDTRALPMKFDMLLPDERPSTGIYSFTGYALEVNEPRVEHDEYGSPRGFDRALTSYYVMEARASGYAKVACDPTYHFVAEFYRTLPIPVPGMPGRSPHPRGISGGGLFFWGSPDKIWNSPPPPKLAGIATEYYPKKRLIVATGTRALRHGLLHAIYT